jgi:hypothetical protein
MVPKAAKSLPPPPPQKNLKKLKEEKNVMCAVGLLSVLFPISLLGRIYSFDTPSRAKNHLCFVDSARSSKGCFLFFLTSHSPIRWMCISYLILSISCHVGCISFTSISSFAVVRPELNGETLQTTDVLSFVMCCRK